MSTSSYEVAFDYVVLRRVSKLENGDIAILCGVERSKIYPLRETAIVFPEPRSAVVSPGLEGLRCSSGLGTV
jgi:hypothetical protein